MPVRRDPRTGRWFFRASVHLPDGATVRIFGTPGTAGAYADLPNTKAGAIAAEKRAIAETLNRKEVATPTIVIAKSETNESVTENAAPKATTTIREHAKTFLENYKPESKPAAHRDRRYSLEGHLLPFLGDKAIEDLRQTDIDAFSRAEITRGVAIKTINNRLSVLSSLIKYVTGERPRLRFKLSGKGAEIHAVDPVDVERMLDACTDDRFRAVILLASEAGLRMGEVRGLQWTDIKNGLLTVRRGLDKENNAPIAPKHNKVRTVPLSPRLTALLAKLPRTGLWVVPRADGGALNYYELLRAVREIYTRARVTPPPAPLHCLRHTFGTVMARRVPLGVLQQLMGHADVQTTMRYVDVSEADKRDAIAAVFGEVSAARGSTVAANTSEPT
jgi:integrase